MASETGVSEEFHLNYERQEDAKVEIVASAASTLAGKVKELFAADGLVAQMVQEAKARGPVDFARRRYRRRRFDKYTNGDDYGGGLLVWILLLVVLVGGGVTLHKLSAIQKGQADHEQRIDRIERSAQPDPSPRLP